MRILALNTGSDFHLLDHIAPLADLLGVSLLTTEEKNFKLAKTFYPNIQVQYVPDLEFRLKEVAESYDVLIECKYWKPHLKKLFLELYKKDITLIFCPHGQSDKGFGFPLLKPYEDQDAVLTYGSLMNEMLVLLNIKPKKTILVGNYRKKFYESNQPFYDEALKKVVQVDSSKRTVLYAPTWKDADETRSFFEYGLKVIQEVPDDWNLILKLHPLLEERTPIDYFHVIRHIDKKKNVFLLDEFPPVYPVLNIADIYLGDFSSVGYDFLGFEKPLYFLPTETPSRIYSCGKMLDASKNFYSQFENLEPFKEEQKKLYSHAFTKTPKDLLTQLVGEQKEFEDHLNC